MVSSRNNEMECTWLDDSNALFSDDKGLYVCVSFISFLSFKRTNLNTWCSITIYK